MGAHIRKNREASMKKRRGAARRANSAGAGPGAPGPGAATSRIDVKEMRSILRRALVRVVSAQKQRPPPAPSALLPDDGYECDALNRAIVDLATSVAQKREPGARTRARAPNSALHEWVEKRLSLPVSDMVSGGAFDAARLHYFDGDRHQWERHMGVFAESITKSLSMSIIKDNDLLGRLIASGDSARLSEALRGMIEVAVANALRMLAVVLEVSKDLATVLGTGNAKLKRAAIENMTVVLIDVLTAELVPALLPVLGDDASQHVDIEVQLRKIRPHIIDAVCKKIIGEITQFQQQLPQDRAQEGRSS